MRILRGIGSLALAMSGALGLSAASFPVADIRPVRTMDFSRPKRRKTGVTYPHSSTRQRARYARQTAAAIAKAEGRVDG